MSMLEGSPNQFGGFVVNPGALPEDAGRFRRRLADAMDDWADVGIRWRGWRCRLRAPGLCLRLQRRGFGIITRMRIM